MAAGCQVEIEASGLESVGSVFIPQLSVADQGNRGDTWRKRYSRRGLGLLLALQSDLDRHILCKVRGLEHKV